MNLVTQDSTSLYHKRDIDKIFENLSDANCSNESFSIFSSNLLIHIDEGFNERILEGINNLVQNLESDLVKQEKLENSLGDRLNKVWEEQKEFLAKADSFYNRAKELVAKEKKHSCGLKRLIAKSNKFRLKANKLNSKISDLEKKLDSEVDATMDLEFKLNELAKVKEDIEYFSSNSKDVNFLISCCKDDIKASSALELLRKYRVNPQSNKPEDEKKVNEFLDRHQILKGRKYATRVNSRFFLVKFPDSLRYHGRDEELKYKKHEEQEKIISYNLSMHCRRTVVANISSSSYQESGTRMLRVDHFQYSDQELEREKLVKAFQDANFTFVESPTFFDIKLPDVLETSSGEKKIKGAVLQEVESYLSDFLSFMLDTEISAKVIDARQSKDLIYSFRITNYNSTFNYGIEDRIEEAFSLFFPTKKQYEFRDMGIPKAVNYNGETIQTESASVREIERYLSHILSEHLETPICMSISEDDGEKYEYSFFVTSYENTNLSLEDYLKALKELSFDTLRYEFMTQDTQLE